MRARSDFLLLVIAAALLSGCSDRPVDRAETGPAAPLRIAVVNYRFSISPRRSGEIWWRSFSPRPKEKTRPTGSLRRKKWLSTRKRTAFFSTEPITQWVEHVSLPNSRMVDTSRSFSDQLIPVERGATHPEGEHTHGWTSNWLLLSSGCPCDKTAGIAGRARRTFVSLEKELRAIDADLREIFKTNRGRKFIFSHPVYQYFTRAYGIDGQSVHSEPEEVPTDSMWADFVKLRTEYPADIMIWKGEPHPEIRKRLADIGVTCVVVNPFGGVPERGDLLSVLRENAEVLRTIE